MRRNTAIKLTVTIAVVVAMIVGYFYMYPLTKSVDNTLIGIQFRYNDQIEEYEEKEITIKVTKEYFLFGKDIFGDKRGFYYGTFSIEGYDFTFDMEATVSASLHGNGGPDFGGVIIYSKLIGNFPSQRFLGTIVSTENLDEFIICVNEPVGQSPSQFSGLVICAPAKDRQEAEQLIKQSNSWLNYFPPLDS